MTYDKALDIIMPLYDFLICGTSTMRDIEEIMIAVLVRKGANKSSARNWVKRFLDS